MQYWGIKNSQMCLNLTINYGDIFNQSLMINFLFALDKLDFKRRRTERIRRERIDSPLCSDMENRTRSRTNSQSDPIRRGRGRPKSVGLKKQEEEKGKINHYLQVLGTKVMHILSLNI